MVNKIVRNSEVNITVFDALCGSGKSTKIIEKIKEAPNSQKFCYIAPLLDEAHRIAGTEYEEDDLYKRPVTVNEDNGVTMYYYDTEAPLADKRFRHPIFSQLGGKAKSLPKLIADKENIVSTHQLFTNLSTETLRGVEDYILIIDEEIKVYDMFNNYSYKDVQALFMLKIIELEEDGLTIKFNYDKFGNVDDDNKIEIMQDTAYGNLANLCDTKQLYYIDGKVIVWELAKEILTAFKEVWVCSYMFESSFMSSYLKSHKLDYNLVKFGKKPSDIAHLINIYDSTKKGNLNEIGDKARSLCKARYENSKTALEKELKTKLHSFFRNNCKAEVNNTLWTTFETNSSKIGGARYKESFLACNTKATNNYRHITNVAYLINLYANPMLIKAACREGIQDADTEKSYEIFALSSMVQFIFRSAIRNGEPINLYIPSKRMRDLLNKWLANGFEV